MSEATPSSGRYPPKSRVRRAAPVAVTLVKSVSGTTTIVGFVASFVIAGLFPQSRSLFVIGFAGWLGLCVYVGGLLDGNRAYSGILSGYTVALVAVTQIDSPQNIFSAGVNRGAAIVVGIAALALISDLLAAPNVHTGLSSKLIAAHRRVRAFALAILRDEA